MQRAETEYLGPGQHHGHDDKDRADPSPTTDSDRPNHAAISPDSKPPSWFDELMKTAFTAETRPRIASGVSDCTRVLADHDADVVQRAGEGQHGERQQAVVREPKTMVATPNPATATSRAGRRRQRRPVRQGQSHHQRGPGAVTLAQPAEPGRANVQDVAGEDRLAIMR